MNCGGRSKHPSWRSWNGNSDVLPRLSTSSRNKDALTLYAEWQVHDKPFRKVILQIKTLYFSSSPKLNYFIYFAVVIAEDWALNQRYNKLNSFLVTFKLSGRLFDKDGNLNNWWSVTSGSGFSTRSTCLARQYSKYEVYGKKVWRVCNYYNSWLAKIA